MAAKKETKFDPSVDLRMLRMTGGQLICQCGTSDSLEWCEHIHRYLMSGEDAKAIHPDMNLIVPVFPNLRIFIEVSIGSRFFDTDSALMEAKFAPDIGKERSIHLGFWNPGEGMMSIRSVLIDYCRSKTDPRDAWVPIVTSPLFTKCPSKVHGLAEERRKSRLTGAERLRCLWDIVMEGACSVCVALSTDPTGANFGVANA